MARDLGYDWMDDYLRLILEGAMRMLLASALLVASLAVAGPVEVKAESGNDLLGHCSAAENNHWERGLCASNIGSAVESLSALKNMSPETSPLAKLCPAGGISVVGQFEFLFW